MLPVVEEYSVLEDSTKKTSEVHALDFCPTRGDLLASGSSDGSVRVWDINNPSKVIMSYNLKATVNSISWNLTSNYLAAGTAIGDISVLNVLNKNEKFDPFKHPNYNAVKKIKFSPFFENYIFSSSSDGSVYLWDVNKSKSTQPLQSYKHHSKSCTSVAFSGNSDKIVCSVGYDSKVVFYDFRDNK